MRGRTRVLDSSLKYILKYLLKLNWVSCNLSKKLRALSLLRELCGEEITQILENCNVKFKWNSAKNAIWFKLNLIKLFICFYAAYLSEFAKGLYDLFFVISFGKSLKLHPFSKLSKMFLIVPNLLLAAYKMYMCVPPFEFALKICANLYIHLMKSFWGSHISLSCLSSYSLK